MFEKPAEILEGRQEIYDAWEAAVGDGNDIDEEALHYAAYGAVQLGCNGHKSRLVDAFVFL